MFERYTDSARRALFFARYEVTDLGGRSIEPEHLLLGVLRSATLLVSRILREAGIESSELRDEITRRLAAGETVSTSVEIPFGDGTKRALHLAAEEADRLRHKWIGTEHLLLALLRDDERENVGTILTARGLRLEPTRARVAELLAASPELALHPDPAADPADVVARIAHIQRLVEQFAQDAINRGASAEEAQIIVEEFEGLKRVLSGDWDE